MGQRTNPNILRLGTTKNWKYRYVEKKASETAIYDFKSIEIQKFVQTFLKNNGLNLHNCKINYSENDNLHILVSYYANLEFKNLNNQLNEKSVNKNLFSENTQNRNNYAYKTFSYIKDLKLNSLKKKKLAILKKKINKKSIYFLKPELTLLTTKANIDKNLPQINSFLNFFLESLSKFLNTKINIFLTIKQLNTNFKKNINRKKIDLLKKKILKLNRYQKNEFFKESLTTLFVCAKKKNSANLLAELIATQLKKLKRHNFFLKFVKNCLLIFKNNKQLKLKGIKIKIKGRLNKARRARQRTIRIGYNLPILTINSDIDYAEKISFTPNGTLGVKVWTLN